MVLFASVIALIATGYAVLSGQQQLSAIQRGEYLNIAIGAIMVMLVAQTIFSVGVQLSNMTTMALTLLAFPFISLILDLLLGRIKLSSLGIYELVGFVLIIAGYLVYISPPQAH